MYAVVGYADPEDTGVVKSRDLGISGVNSSTGFLEFLACSSSLISIWLVLFWRSIWSCIRLYIASSSLLDTITGSWEDGFDPENTGAAAFFGALSSFFWIAAAAVVAGGGGNGGLPEDSEAGTVEETILGYKDMLWILRIRFCLKVNKDYSTVAPRWAPNCFGQKLTRQFPNKLVMRLGAKNVK